LCGGHLQNFPAGAIASGYSGNFRSLQE